MQWSKIIIGSSTLTLVGIGFALSSLAATQELSANTKSAVVMIAHYNQEGDFTGWGSGFFVDERIVVTNKHVIEGGYYYRVFATGSGDIVDLNCARTLTRSDVKINLDDDVAYVRASLPCSHGTMYFAKADPQVGDSVSVLGYPFRGSLKASLPQSRTAGTVTGMDEQPWMTTDAFVDFGNSGGPVVKDDRVVGVVVAKRVDAQGKFVEGLFVPVSEIIRGLANANDSTFGYTPQTIQNNPAYRLPESSGPKTNADCAVILGDGGQAADDGGCKCASGYSKDSTGTMCVRQASEAQSSSASSISSAVRSRSSASSSVRRFSSSASSAARPATPRSFRTRVCDRVHRLFSNNAKMRMRVNARLQKRFGFTCE